jgi:STE24 endopeptidase
MQTKQPRLNYKRQKLAREYASITRRLSLINMAVVGAILLILIFGGLSVRLSHFLALSQPWASALYFVVLAVGFGIITIPLTYYEGFTMPHRYGLSHQRFPAWLADRAKASGLSLVFGLVVVISVYWLLDRFPDMWWLWAALFLFLLSVLLSRLTPTLLLPIFFKLEPLGDTKLKKRLKNLAKRARAPISRVLTMNASSKGTTANAMLAGMGRTRSIILTDTMLQKYTADEIEVVLAHELGHHIHKDIPKLIALQAAMILLGLYVSNLVLRATLIPLHFQGIADAAALPVLFLSVAVLTMIITPFINAFSRHVEAAADKAALELTNHPKAFIAVMTRLTNQNLSVAAPSRWQELLFYDHPPYTKRVGQAKGYV